MERDRSNDSNMEWWRISGQYEHQSGSVHKAECIVAWASRDEGKHAKYIQAEFLEKDTGKWQSSTIYAQALIYCYFQDKKLARFVPTDSVPISFKDAPGSQPDSSDDKSALWVTTKERIAGPK